MKFTQRHTVCMVTQLDAEDSLVGVDTPSAKTNTSNQSNKNQTVFNKSK